jgi:hypothetical protein
LRALPEAELLKPVRNPAAIAVPYSVGLEARRTSNFTGKIRSREQGLDAAPLTLDGLPVAVTTFAADMGRPLYMDLVFRARRLDSYLEDH